MLSTKTHLDEKLSDGLPPLPPYLQPKRRRGSRFLVLPDIRHCAAVDRIPDHANNWWTLIYRRMVRIETESGRIWYTHTSTRVYKQWLEIYNAPNGIPPHIAFGGAIEPGERDETFYHRWEDYARSMFT